VTCSFSRFIETPAQLRAVYEQPSGGAVAKEIGLLDVHCRRFIEMSPFVCIGTTSETGAADVSPRGDAPGFV
jgi:predicted pyridoxine 5'-phosphate oxidase superfamily flavin-nucleotide-binding protein